MADATSDQIKALQAQLNALQKEVKQLRAEAASKPKAATATASALDVGGSFNIGRQTLPSAFNAATGTTSFGVGGQAPRAYSTFLFGEVDLTYLLADVQYNAEIEYGQQNHAAFNGGQAQWYGISLLAHRKFNIDGIGRMGATLRYDYLADSKNGGGGGIALNSNGMDTANGFGIGADWLANSKANGGLGFECKGANRQDIALDLLFYPTQQIQVKVEYRHDWANNRVFLRNDGSYGKSNDLLATQLIYSFELSGATRPPTMQSSAGV